MRNLPKRGALPRAETQKWLNRLKPFFSDETNISRFDASAVTGCVLKSESAPVGACFFDRLPVPPAGWPNFATFGQAFELLVCAELVQAVNADLNRLGVV